MFQANGTIGAKLHIPVSYLGQKFFQKSNFSSFRYSIGALLDFGFLTSQWSAGEIFTSCGQVRLNH